MKESLPKSSPSSSNSAYPMPTGNHRRIVDGVALANALRASANSYCCLPPHADVAIALWVLHTYVFDNGEFSPILAITSDGPAAGKTKLIHWLDTVVCAPLYKPHPRARGLLDDIESFSPSGDYLADLADLGPNARPNMSNPTLLLDGVERMNASLIEMLTGGFSQRESLLDVPRAARDDSAQPYSTWCPKALAKIGPYPKVVASRSIQIRMQPKPPGMRLSQFELAPDRPLVAGIARWAVEQRSKVTGTVEDWPSEIGNRAADKWSILLNLADVIGGEWPKLAREAMVNLEQEADDAVSPDSRFLGMIRNYFQETGHSVAFTNELLDHLDSKKQPRDPKWTAKQLASYLSHFQIPTNLTVRRGNAVAKGYKLESLQTAFANLPPPPEPESAAVRSVPQIDERMNVVGHAPSPGERQPTPNAQELESQSCNPCNRVTDASHHLRSNLLPTDASRPTFFTTVDVTDVTHVTEPTRAAELETSFASHG